jgi:hypothetical protein
VLLLAHASYLKQQIVTVQLNMNAMLIWHHAVATDQRQCSVGFHASDQGPVRFRLLPTRPYPNQNETTKARVSAAEMAARI